MRPLDKKICLTPLAGYCFNRVLDVGCSKGAITQFLKKQNNQVVALDLGETSLRVARGRYPDIQFLQANVRAADFDLTRVAGKFDLVVCMEMLSYIANWRSLLAQFSRVARYALVALYLPQDPIGIVKSLDELLAEFAAHFTIIEDVRFVSRHIYSLVGEFRRSQ